MKNEIEEIVISLLEENDYDPFNHKFLVKNHIMYDENNATMDLSKVIFGSIYAHELVLYYSSKEKYLICYEGIEKLDAL